MKIPLVPAGALALMLSTSAFAQVTTTVVDIPTRGITDRILYVRPAAPVANIIALPGGEQYFNLTSDGTIGLTKARCYPPYRIRDALAAHGYAIAFVDWASDHAIFDPQDLNNVFRFLQQHDKVPTWVIGVSSSTPYAATLAGALPADSPVGVMFLSTDSLPATLAASVRRTAEVIYHNQDDPLDSLALFNALTAAPAKEKTGLSGGSASGCGYHLYDGIEDLLTATITGFIDAHNGSLAPSTTENVVEYHHAAFDHYFITPVPDEIAKLDDRAPPFQDWTRTGVSFHAYVNATAPASSVAVCRFFNTSFAPKSSHFYALHGLSCETTLAQLPDWKLEDDKLVNALLPDAGGACPAGSIPVYRLYNAGMGGAPNHRFVTSLGDRQAMVDKGYIPEGSGIGVGMCVPL